MNWSDKSEVMKELEANPLNLQHASAELQDDPEVALHAIRKDASVFQFASERLKNDNNFCLDAIRIHPKLVGILPKSILLNTEFISKAFKIWPELMKHMPLELRDDASYVVSVLTINTGVVDFGSIIYYCTDKVKISEEICYEQIKRGHTVSLSDIPKELQSKRSFLLRIINGQLAGTIYNPKDKSDKSGIFFIKQYIKNHGGKFDKELMLQVLVIDGMLLKDAAAELQNDLDVVRVAIKQNELAAQHASKELKLQPELYNLVIDKCGENHAFIRDNLIKAIQAGYIEPSTEQIELLEQIKCDGLVQLNRTKAKNQAPEFKLTEAKYVFERGASDLAVAIENFFQDEMALFEYNIFYPNTTTAKGVVINHYGGYGNYNFRNPLPLTPNDRQSLFLQEGYIVINLSTHDNWQTLHQSNQCNENSKEGMALLSKTLLQLILFAQATKIRFAGIPLIYLGASFGAFKGALVNILLSNKNALDQFNVKGLFNRLFSLLKTCATNLFDAYILHDGGYDYLSSLGIDKLPNPIQNETLILHNFDDERVNIDAALKMLEDQFLKSAHPGIISFYLTPRAASKIKQVPDGGGPSSTDGHFVPVSVKYQTAYYKVIKKFIASLGQKKDGAVALTQIRFDQAKLFRDQRDSLSELKYAFTLPDQRDSLRESTAAAYIYRLYYALLQLDDKSINMRVDRLRLVFSLLAYNSSEQDKEAAYESLLFAKGPALLEKVAKRNSTLRKYFVQQVRKKINNQKFFQLKPVQEKEIPKEKETDWFVLTQDAHEYLKNVSDPLPLIQRCSQFAISIDKNVLEFFSNHEGLKSIDDLRQLWDLGAHPLPLTIDLSSASRILSIMKQYYPDRDQCAKVFVCLQNCELLAIIYHLGVHGFNLEELQYLANKLQQQPPSDRESFISALADLCCRFTDKRQAIDWLLQMEAAKRNKMVKRYKTASWLFGLQTIPRLKDIQEHPELLNAYDFTHSAVALQKFKA